MTKNKKLLTVILSIIAVLILVVTAFPVAPRFYLGNRIKGNVSVTVDETSYDLSQLEVTSLGNYNVREKNGKISIRGGKYGRYGFSFNVPETDCTVTVSIMQRNWHQITDFDLDIELSAENGGLSCNYAAKTSETYNETFKRTVEKYDGKADHNTNGFEIFI